MPIVTRCFTGCVEYRSSRRRNSCSKINRFNPGRSRSLNSDTPRGHPMSVHPIARDTLVCLLAGGQGERLYPLTRDRAKPAVPFGGIYRIIDITLSNCINSELRRVFVLTQYKALSLNRHIRESWY